MLTWSLPSGFNASKTILYRGKGKEAESIYKTLEGEVLLFEDFNLEINTPYYYRIRVLSMSGETLVSARESSLSVGSGRSPVKMDMQ